MRQPLLQLAALLLLAAPLSAEASVSLTLAKTKFGASECTAATATTATWNLADQFVTGGELKLWASKNSSCAADATDLPYTVSASVATGSVSVPLRDFIRDGSDCTGTSDAASPGTGYLCLSYKPTTSTTTPATASVTVKFAMQQPTEPANVTVEGGNNLLRVSWTKGDGAEAIASYDVFVAPEGTAITGAGTATNTTSLSVTVAETQDNQALVNDQPYDVRVRAHDDYGNLSPLSAVVTGSPQAVADFYTWYRDAGGKAVGGGCASAPLGPLSLVGLLALRRRARTRRAAGRRSAARLRGPFLVGAAVALVALLAAAPARAQFFETRRTTRPERRTLFALKFDKYDPQIDSEAALGGATPYKDIFAGRVPWRGQLEVDVAPVHFLGSWMIGVTAGFWQNIGKGIVKKTGLPSGDTALLNIIPLGLVATWRFDWLADRYRWFPLIPYGQLGLAASLWQSKGGDGNTSTYSDGSSGSGWTTGWTAALGLALSIDQLSPGLANEAYIDMGLQRTSLFVEYGWTNLSGFGSDSSLILSDKAVRFGLALEF